MRNGGSRHCTGEARMTAIRTPTTFGSINSNRSQTDRMSELTHVELEWTKGRVENWIRFGRTAEQRIINSQRRIVSFAPGSVFAFVRWASNDYGTILSRIDILRAVSPGEPWSTVPHVRPGRESLLRLFGWPKVEKVLHAIDGIEALGIDPADAAPDHSTYSQPPLRRRTTKTLQSQQASSLAASAKAGAMRTRIATLALTAAAAALLAGTVGPRPTPRLVWNASESVPTGLYRVQPPPPQAHRYRSCRRIPTRTAGAAPRRGRISSARRAADQTDLGAAGADRLPDGSQHNRR